MSAAFDAPPDQELVKELVTEIVQIRANLDAIAHRENKLRRAINYFSVERSLRER